MIESTTCRSITEHVLNKEEHAQTAEEDAQTLELTRTTLKPKFAVIPSFRIDTTKFSAKSQDYTPDRRNIDEDTCPLLRADVANLAIQSPHSKRRAYSIATSTVTLTSSADSTQDSSITTVTGKVRSLSIISRKPRSRSVEGTRDVETLKGREKKRQSTGAVAAGMGMGSIAGLAVGLGYV